MNYQEIEQELGRFAKIPGVDACALVAIDTGMIYLTSSNKEQFEIIAEGARDYWILHQKNGNVFDALGPMNNIIVHHKLGLLFIQACGQTMLLIAVVKIKQVDWTQWPTHIRRLCSRITELEIGKKTLNQRK